MAFTCCLDEDAKAQLRVSKAIERELEQWKRDSSREFKLLLLGMTVPPMIHRCGRYAGLGIFESPGDCRDSVCTSPGGGHVSGWGRLPALC